MKKVNVLRFFLASPSDVKAERQMFFALKEELDFLVGKDKNIKFELSIGKKTHIQEKEMTLKM